MTEQNQQRMWNIDQRAQLGDPISESDVEFFNAHFELMVEEMNDNANHWKYHTSKIK